ncbi:MAG: hypothetical protein AAGL29_01510 [Bacteroidota bacterium]
MRDTNKNFVGKNYREVFKYEFIPTFEKDSEDFMIRFSSIKNADHLLGKLLGITNQLGFEPDGTNEVIDEIWIHASSKNGRITITRDVWDMVFILAENNKIDLERIERELNGSDDFERIAAEV